MVMPDMVKWERRTSLTAVGKPTSSPTLPAAWEADNWPTVGVFHHLPKPSSAPLSAGTQLHRRRQPQRMDQAAGGGQCWCSWWQTVDCCCLPRAAQTWLCISRISNPQTVLGCWQYLTHLQMGELWLRDNRWPSQDPKASGWQSLDLNPHLSDTQGC